MTEKEKTILELISKYLKNNGCEYAEIDVDPYNYKPYNGRSFQCGEAYKNNNKFPFDIQDFVNDFIVNNLDDDIETDNLTEIHLRIYPEDRKILLSATYSELTEGDEETLERESSDDSDLKQMMETWIEQGLYSFAEITFDGGGDSGYIDNDVTIYGQGDLPINSNLGDFTGLEDYLYSMLNNFSGWEINEGSRGYFKVDTRAGEVILYFRWMVDKYETIDIETWQY